MTAFEALIAEFAEKSGLDVKADASGSVQIEADGRIVTVQYRPRKGDIVMFALPLYDYQADEPMMRKALELSAHGLGTGGFFLGLHDGSFVLSAVRPLVDDPFGAEMFAQTLLALSRTSQRVADALALASAEEATEKSRESDCNIDGIRV